MQVTIPKITPSALAGLVNQIPDLGDYGFGPYRHRLGDTREELDTKFAKDRQFLLESFDRVEATCAWIAANLTPIQSMNQSHTSYGLKHVAEEEIDYITNGVFIAAMILMGYRYERVGANAIFNCSEKAIKRCSARINDHANARVRQAD